MKSLFFISAFLFALVFGPSVSQVADDITIIDVMVLYTPAAETSVTKPKNTPITEWIPEAVAATNQALINSEALIRLDLVHFQKINYLESNNEVDLQKLTDGIGNLRDVEQLRDYYHADLVILVTNNQQGGRAQALMSLNSEAKCSRFAVVKKGSTSVFVHELGHLLGAKHDEYIKGELDKGIYPYSHGYTGGNWMPNTIVGGFTEVKNGIGKIDFYSNPNLKYRDKALGDPNTADNVHTFNNTAPVIAECTSSLVTWTGVVSNRWSDSRNWSGNYVPRKIDDVDIPFGLSRYPVISSGQQYARSLVIDRGATLTMTAGNLVIRHSLFASGDLIANGGSVQLQSLQDLPTQINLNDNSRLANLIIGNDEGANTWVKAMSNLVIENDLILQSNALFDQAGKIVTVKGDWKGQGNGIDLSAENIRIGGATVVEPLNITFPIQANPEGSYISAHPGMMTLAEKGNYGFTWMFGGKEGQAWLNTENNYYPDDSKYMNSVDAWLFLPATVLQKGLNYSFSFDAMSQLYGHDFEYSVYYGKTQLPSKMIPAIGKQLSKGDNKWQTFKGSFRVPESGVYYLGIRSSVPEVKYQAHTYIKNLKIKDGSAQPVESDCSTLLGAIKYRDHIPLGKTLYEEERLVSANGLFQLRYAPNETFVIEEVVDPANCTLKKIWSTRPLNFPINDPPRATYLNFKADDGNVCIISKLGSAYCFTNGRDENVGLLYNSEKLQLTDRGRLVLLNKMGAEVWSNSPPPPDKNKVTAKYQTVMQPGDMVEEGESLTSQNGAYQLRVNKTNRLVIEQVDPATKAVQALIWTAPITGRLNNPDGTNSFQMNPDCNLCFTSKMGHYFCITTGRDDNAKILNQCGELTLTNSGQLIMYSKMGVELWRSH